MRYPRNSWAILPATRSLWNTTKITIDRCGEIWDNGTVLVCEKESYSGKMQIAFIHGAQGDYGVKIGDVKMCHHDQTGAFKGEYRILNILQWKKVDGRVVITSQVPFNDTTKASLAVFK